MVQDIHNHYSLNEFHKFNEIGQDFYYNDEIIEDYYQQTPSSSSFVTLRNGVQMPLLGLGQDFYYNDEIIEDYYQQTPSSSSFVTLRNGVQMPLLGLALENPAMSSEDNFDDFEESPSVSDLLPEKNNVIR
uniref:Uncharacterized protein n=1 Tax=Panagrolaimus sp. JU765 TaxID=591449 RepID=A0AC34QHY7_9BILA